MWAVDQDGRAYLSNYTEMQRVIGTYGDGPLILDGDGIKLIGVHADTEWQYDLNGSAVNESFIGANDTIMIVSNHAITAIYKVRMSSTMVAMFVMVVVGPSAA
jgi:hypothetical protein